MTEDKKLEKNEQPVFKEPDFDNIEKEIETENFEKTEKKKRGRPRGTKNKTKEPETEKSFINESAGILLFISKLLETKINKKFALTEDEISTGSIALNELLKKYIPENFEYTPEIMFLSWISTVAISRINLFSENKTNE